MLTQKHRGRLAAWGLASLLAAAALFALAGCGGGGAGDISAPSFTRAAVVTNPAPLSWTGGTATLSVQVDDPSGVVPESVTINVATSTGTSLTNGLQVMALAPGTTDVYTLDVAVPDNRAGTTPVVYTAKVDAADKLGNKTGTRAGQTFTLGSITVPNPPPPPSGP